MNSATSSTPLATNAERRAFMQRAAACTVALVAGVLATPCVQAQPSYTVSLAQLHEVVAQKFPRSVPVQGLIDLTLQAPQLRLVPATNRLGALMAVNAAGPALRRSHAGSFDVEFALRYEPSDRTLRAHQIQLGRLDFPSLKPSVTELLNAYGPALAAQSLGEVTLHQLRAKDTALFDAMGLQPGPITVTDKGLVVGFVQKPAQ
jgi:hypothetical protein